MKYTHTNTHTKTYYIDIFTHLMLYLSLSLSNSLCLWILYKIDLAKKSPLFASNVLFRSGSLIRPFHPTVVLGFSKYTLITINKFSENFSLATLSFSAYSRADFSSCMEQGPHITTNLSSLPCKIWLISFLVP